MYTYFISYAAPKLDAFGCFTMDRTHPIQSQHDIDQVLQGVRDASRTPDVVLLNFQLLSGPDA